MKIIDVPKSILDLLSLARAEGTESWGTPEPIQRELLPVPQFDPAMLPEPLRDWVVDIAHRMQCAIEYVAVAALVMFGSVIGTACCIRPKQRDNWTVAPNIWGAVIGRPSRRKSPAISEAMKPLRALDHEAREAHDSALMVHERDKLTRKLTVDLKKKEFGKRAGLPTADEIKDLAVLSNNRDEEPKCRRYFTNDCTFEILGEILRDNPRGLLILHDELMGLLEGFSRQGREGERPFYLSAWTGLDSHRVDRIGRGEVFIPRLAASLFGGIQPDKLEQYMCFNENDGFIQRFQLMVYPDDLPDAKVVDEAPNKVAEARVMEIVRHLAHCDFEAIGAKVDSASSIPYFRFEAKQAQPVLYDWLKSIDLKARGQDASLMEEHLGKYGKLVPALALIFHVVELMETATKPGAAAKKRKRTGGVSLNNLKLALKWANFLEAHAKRIYAMASDARIQVAQALARKIEAGELADGFSERDIYRKEWSVLREPEEVKAACAELEAAGWIRRIPVQGKHVGRPAAPKYEINPKLKLAKNATADPTKPTKGPKARAS